VLSSQGADKPEVRYYPTPQAVIDRMLEMAKVTKKDVVYDLGGRTGESRHRRKKHGAKAVGVEIDPVRVKAPSRDLVTIRKEEHVQDRPRRRERGRLYLNDKANLALRPALKKSLNRARASCRKTWDMGDWRPEPRPSR